MNITGPIRQLIVDNATAAAIVDERVFPVVLPQETTYPAVRLTVLDTKGNETKTSAADWDKVQFEISSFATTYDEAQRLDDAIRAAIDTFSGVVTVGAIAHGFKLIQYTRRQDLFEPEVNMFHRRAEYVVIYALDAASMIPSQLVGGNYESDEAALLAGLEYGQYYHAFHHVSAAQGTLIKLIPNE